MQFIFNIKSVNKNEAEIRFITSVIKKTAERNKIRASFSNDMSSTDSVFNTFWIDIIEFGTKYPGFASNKFLGDKTVKRNLSGKIRVYVQGVNYAYTTNDTIYINYNDKVDYNEIENIESEDYDFTRAIYPRVSFWEEIVFPVALIIVSVTAAVLFFTIRSK